jgi:phthiocerol/phenolphthiocerol synthesis type-I polyketide synthase E
MKDTTGKIAVIGMACRFPGADNIDEFWENLIQGRETLTHFTDEEIAKVEPYFDKLKDNPEYVRVRGVINDVDKFDAPFFGIPPKEATETDPQQRVWLETAWKALEHSGCDPFRYRGAVGVFTGGGLSSYLINNILRDPRRMEEYFRPDFGASTQMILGNDTPYMATKTAYYFNLKGPAVFVQTACSTSLVAIAQACQSLYSFESDVCLAGGIRISVPQERGYLYQEGAIVSPDGRCRPFDEQAGGMVGSNGVGVVVLKRLEDAIKDHDTIYALVSGWALNNDGSNKVSFTAPSIDGQAEVIMMAQSLAEVSPEEIGYIEAHGTATKIGDPIEVAGLTKAFSAKTDKKQFCGLGSVKSNIGHADAAAGVASFIKVCLSAYNKRIPPSLHFTKPNPHIDFANSPFYVLNETKEWIEEKPLIMGVSSFGIGGTNAHVIVEEPSLAPKETFRESNWPDLLLLSTKSEESLHRRKQELIEFMKKNPGLDIHDISNTLAFGRSHMQFRSFITAYDLREVVDGVRAFTDGKKEGKATKVTFMFPGQGAQYVNMGLDLYRKNQTFREILDECFTVYKSETGRDLKPTIFNENSDDNNRKLASTELAQPALFIIEYALSKILEQLGIRPDFMIGHSIGEYTAACLAGVFDLHTGLKIVIKRGELMSKMPPGNMMAVRASIDKLKDIYEPYFEIAAENASESCTISFKPEDSDKVKALLEENNISYVILNTSHGFHSAAFDPILSEFRDYVNQFDLKSPEIPFISCFSGDFITDAQATSGAYWSQQLRNTVWFRRGILSLVRNEELLFLEVGPNTHLGSITRQFRELSNKKQIISTLGKPDDIDEHYKMVNVLGNMFNIGFEIDFKTLLQGNHPYKIGLPTYPFEKKSYWIDFKVPEAVTRDTGNEMQGATETLLEEDSSTQINELKSLADTDHIAVKITSIWKSLMGRDDFGPDDDFFEIGGQSLLALQILNKIKEDMGVKITVRELLDNSTINMLSSLYIKKAQADE